MTSFWLDLLFLNTHSKPEMHTQAGAELSQAQANLKVIVEVGFEVGVEGHMIGNKFRKFQSLMGHGLQPPRATLSFIVCLTVMSVYKCVP